jgi:hypothetical protein
VAVEHGRPGQGRAVTGRLSRVSWESGAVLAVLAVNVALIVAGLVVVPEGRRPALWAGPAAITVQCAIAVAAVAGSTVAYGVRALTRSPAQPVP